MNYWLTSSRAERRDVESKVHPVLHDSALFTGEEEHQEHTRKRVGKIMGNHEGFRRVDSRQLDGKGVEGAQGNIFSLPPPPSHRMFRHQLLAFMHKILFLLYRIRFIEELFAFANNVRVCPQEFEDSLLIKMSKEGWDGSEEENNIQWTFAGALFYSIIVITTIGESIKIIQLR